MIAEVEKPNRVTFEQVFTAKLLDADLTLTALSELTGWQTDKLSKTKRGHRACEPALAAELAKHLGGTREGWLDVYELTQHSAAHSLGEYLEVLDRQNVIDVAFRTSETTGQQAYATRLVNIEIAAEMDLELLEDSVSFGIEHFSRGQLMADYYQIRLGKVHDSLNGSPSPFGIEKALAPSQQVKFDCVEKIGLPPHLGGKIHIARELFQKGVRIVDVSRLEYFERSSCTITLVNTGRETIQMSPFLGVAELELWRLATSVASAEDLNLLYEQAGL